MISESAPPIDSLVMVLLGGVQTLTGPVVGAAGYHLLRTELLRHFAEYWRLILGLIVVLLVVVFPTGIVGAVEAASGREIRGPEGSVSVLAVSHIAKSYGGVRAVDDVSFLR